MCVCVTQFNNPYLRLDNEWACVLQRARHSPVKVLQILTTLSWPVCPVASSSELPVILKQDTWKSECIMLNKVESDIRLLWLLLVIFNQNQAGQWQRCRKPEHSLEKSFTINKNAVLISNTVEHLTHIFLAVVHSSHHPISSMKYKDGHGNHSASANLELFKYSYRVFFTRNTTSPILPTNLQPTPLTNTHSNTDIHTPPTHIHVYSQPSICLNFSSQ